LVSTLFKLSIKYLTSTKGNARLAGLEKDLGLKGTQYNKILSVFYISYILFEIPLVMACKTIGPGRFIPTITLLFGICSICTGFCNTEPQISGVRFLLGVLEAPSKYNLIAVTLLKP
jgi:sugar phosphate permease